MAMPWSLSQKAIASKNARRVFILKLHGPTVATIRRLIDARLIAFTDCEQIRGIRVESIHVAEIESLGAGHDRQLRQVRPPSVVRVYVPP